MTLEFQLNRVRLHTSPQLHLKHNKANTLLVDENTNPTPSVSTGTTETFTTSTAPLSPKSPKSEGILKTTTIETATYSPAFGEVLEHHLQSDEWGMSPLPSLP